MATLDMDIVQIDIKTAFLNATLDKPVYMTQPEGFVETGKEDYVCRLLKALYGTKQAPRLWSKRLDEAIVKFGLKPISPAYLCGLTKKKNQFHQVRRRPSVWQYTFLITGEIFTVHG